MAAVSHAPHVVSAALSARFAAADDMMLSLAGNGLTDTTRIAAGAPGLWRDILEHNADPVAAVLESVARDLSATACALRAADRDGPCALADVLTRGSRGRERIAEAAAARVSGDGDRELSCDERAELVRLRAEVAALRVEREADRVTA
jgi:prephenate dehydrogenase